MKNVSLLFLLLLVLFPGFSLAAEAADHGETKWGRSLKLTEVQWITDYEGDFIFKNLRKIRTSKDGSLFISGLELLYKFSPRGEFERSFLKKGEGPGEIKYLSDFLLWGDSVLLGAVLPVKVINFSSDGKLQGERTLHGVPPFSFLIGFYTDKYYFASYGQDVIQNSKSGLSKRNNELFFAGETGKPESMGLSFDTLDLVLKIKSGKRLVIGTKDYTSFLSIFDKEGFIYISHTGRYLVNQVDLKTGKISRKIRRDFKPQKFEKKIYENKRDGEIDSLAERKFYNDIYGLQIFRGNLMIFTSRMNEKREILVDVFNSKGKYIDNFYMKIPGVNRPDDLKDKPILFHDGFFWTTDVDEDDAPYVLKFKLDHY